MLRRAESITSLVLLRVFLLNGFGLGSKFAGWVVKVKRSSMWFGSIRSEFAQGLPQQELQQQTREYDQTHQVVVEKSREALLSFSLSDQILLVGQQYHSACETAVKPETERNQLIGCPKGDDEDELQNADHQAIEITE